MSASDDTLVAWLTARIEQAEREAPHAHERGCFAWDDYHYRHGTTDEPSAGDACECGGPLRAAARVAAEREVVRLVTRLCEITEDATWLAADDALCWLAYGHRFDAPGFEAAWAPHDVKAMT